MNIDINEQYYLQNLILKNCYNIFFVHEFIPHGYIGGTLNKTKQMVEVYKITGNECVKQGKYKGQLKKLILKREHLSYDALIRRYKNKY